MSSLPPPPPSGSPEPGRAELHSGRKSKKRRRDSLIALGALLLILIAVLVVRSRDGGGTEARELTCAPVNPAFLPTLDLPLSTSAQYAKYKDFDLAGGGGSGTIYLVAATVGQHTGVWAVDHDPADPQPKDVVVRAPAASTDAKVISPKVGENIHESAYQRGIPSSEALQASKDVASVSTVEGCL